MFNELYSHTSNKRGFSSHLTEAELGLLVGFPSNPVFRASGADIIIEGEFNSHAYVVTSGWVCSYKLLSDGGRQIVEFQVPGDFLGLQGVLLKSSVLSYQAVTPVRLIAIHVPTVVDAFAKVPQMLELVLRIVSREEAMVVEHLLDLGRRSAITRMAHFMLELGTRLKMIGLATDDGFECPLNQYLLADALGLTAVHVNRVLRQLRECKLLVFKDGYVQFLDRAALVEFAAFDMSYLDQRGTVFH